MISAKKFAAACTSLVLLVAVPGTAHATGYIRIGDKCYVSVGGQYPVYIQMGCPDEVSEGG